MKELNLTQEWDKTFPKSDKVDHKKVQCPTRFGMTLAADVYTGATGATGPQGPKGDTG